MEHDPVLVDFDLMTRFVNDVFLALGVPEEDARICTDVLVAADRWGIPSHGVNRLKPVYYDRIRRGIQSPKTVFHVVREGPTTAVVDGNDGMGQVIATRAMDMAMQKADSLGMGMVAVRNSNHYGIAGYYVSMAAENGKIGITGTNARPAVAPTFGAEGMFGTNPMAFGIPTDEAFPFILDCATSTTQRGKIEVSALTGAAIPHGWVTDRTGNPRTDSTAILDDLLSGDCFLTPLGGLGEEGGGYKGYGYATVVEILSAALQGGRFLKMLTGMEDGNPAPLRLGHFFIAVDVKAFTDLDAFKSAAGDILRTLRTAEKMPGRERIYTAGEKEWLAWNNNRERGIALYPRLQEEILVMRNELGLSAYSFPF
jgi:LDH2 family malate/lactate/ureidoglycolate dehydrogenase